MNTLWMHGMGMRPNQDKIAMMEKFGLETHALHLDYNKEPDRYEILRDYCREHQIELLAGSSMGGFFGFWLNEDLGIPCILLNPAVSLRLKNKNKPAVNQHIAKLCLLALGGKDEQIDPERTQIYMKQDEREGKQIITKVWENEGHGFSVQAFEEILEWGLPIVKAG